MPKIYPCLKERNRYLLINWNGAEGNIRREFIRLFGEYNFLMSRMRVLKVDGRTVVKVRRGYEDLVRATLVLSDFGGNPFVEIITGTARKMRKYLRQKT